MMMPCLRWCVGSTNRTSGYGGMPPALSGWPFAAWRSKCHYFRYPEVMCWVHHEKFSTFEEMQRTKSLGVVDAVTAACALVKRQVFLEIGGFDEVWYPIAYSDTNLAIKLHLKGLKCFYTPYAHGVHHESVTRKEGIEDFENSCWLHRHLLKHQYRVPVQHFY